MRRIASYLAIGIVISLGAYAQIITPEPPSDFAPARVVSTQNPRIQNLNPPVSAIALDVQGSCKVSKDGKKFSDLKKNAELPGKAIVRTGSSGYAELFVKRMGATLRIDPYSEVYLERTEQPGKGEHRDVNTRIEVRKGKIIAIVHKNVPGSTLDLKTAAGKSLTDPVIGSRYTISAASIDDSGVTTSLAELDPQIKAAIKEQMEFDEIQALGEAWADDENPGLGN